MANLSGGVVGKLNNKSILCGSNNSDTTSGQCGSVPLI